MDDRTTILEKIERSEAAGRPDTAALLGLWHFEKKEYPAAFLAFSTAVSVHFRYGFWAVSAWRAEWGAKPLPADFEAKSPLPSACFWAWVGKPDEGLAALQKTGTEKERIQVFLQVYLKLLLLPPGPSSRPPEFRERLEEVIKAEYGVSSDRTRNLLAQYDAGNLAGVLAGLRSTLEQFFAVPPFSSIDYLWLLFLSGIGHLDFASITAALAELEGLPVSPGWKTRKAAAGQLLFYFFLLRAGLESFEKALKINPHFGKAAKNAQLVRIEKPDLVELLKQFSVL
ncbi:MAG: hypothetical protein L0196_03395 [candidate division Zixibacteria bacterium]|nr:hypothetical protein [candidate division Zixibacteria bacterium]